MISDKSLAFVRNLLADCNDNHPACTPAECQEDFQPKRLLDIGTIDRKQSDNEAKIPVRLIETNPDRQSAPYVALSHRWGAPGSTLSTTINTLQDHMEEVLFDHLGTVYQDAIHFLRSLGIRYLWIDSLCIIQDSVNDWKEQSQLMANIYNCAHFTLARHCDDDRIESIIGLRSQLHRVTDHEILVFARLTIPHFWEEEGSSRKQYSGPPPGFPLFSRGWIYQERLLSCRTLHVSDRELSWICCQTSLYERMLARNTH